VGRGGQGKSPDADLRLRGRGQREPREEDGERVAQRTDVLDLAQRRRRQTVRDSLSTRYIDPDFGLDVVRTANRVFTCLADTTGPAPPRPAYVAPQQPAAILADPRFEPERVQGLSGLLSGAQCSAAEEEAPTRF